MSAWTLCVPVDLEPDAMRWWNKLCRRMKRDHALVCELWSANPTKAPAASPGVRGGSSLLFSRRRRPTPATRD